MLLAYPFYFSLTLSLSLSLSLPLSLIHSLPPLYSFFTFSPSPLAYCIQILLCLNFTVFLYFQEPYNIIMLSFAFWFCIR
jgi:hypothetical protein